MPKLIKAYETKNSSKKCSKCQKTKLIEEFSRHPKAKDGIQPHCKPCRSLYMKKYWEKKRGLSDVSINEPASPALLHDPAFSKKRNLAATFVPPKIDKGVPIPPKGYGDVIVQFLQTMEVDDSFVTPSGKINTYLAAAKKLGIKLLARSEDPLHSRVWRIK